MENLYNAAIIGQFGFEENSGREIIYDYGEVIVSKNTGLRCVFEKHPISWRISVDGSPNPRNKGCVFKVLRSSADVAYLCNPA